MRTWEYINYTNTFRELVDKINKNSDSSKFIDEITGNILCNGIIYNGRETINGASIKPLEPVDVSGVVTSDTILDNFKLYFRDSNIVVEVNEFPIDLLSYKDNKLHFIFIKQDLTYRVSDYMFGAADEILLARFVINTNGTWQQLYFMASREGTPEYDSADEFYNVDGLFVKSPGGLELSQTAGSVKRSGIDFTDKISPDVKKYYKLASERVPIRYVNTQNEIDYTTNVQYNVITNKYMVYNMNKKLKIKAQQKVQDIQNLYYGIQNYCNDIASELHEAIVSGGDVEDLTPIVKAFTSYIDSIYEQVDVLSNILEDSTLSSVDRTNLTKNKTLVNTYMNKYLKGEAISSVIDNTQVMAISNMSSYIKHIDPSICDIPLEDVLQKVLDDLDGISYNAGKILSVDSGKFTIQRILWDIYEDCLIVQYGDTVYNNFEDAVTGSNLLAYPAPWGKTIYIPLAIMIIKSGTTSINDDNETIIIDRKNIYVDQENSDYADYVARARASKALSLYVPNLHINVTLSTNGWKSSTTYSGFYEYKLENVNIVGEPYIIELVVKDVRNLKSVIVAKPGSQTNGSITVMTKNKPTVNLEAYLIIQKGEKA